MDTGTLFDINLDWSPLPVMEQSEADELVVALALSDCIEVFPAASYAAAVYEYVVAAARPASEYVVPVTVAIWVPPQ